MCSAMVIYFWTGSPKKGRLWKLTRHSCGQVEEAERYVVNRCLNLVGSTLGNFMLHHGKISVVSWGKGIFQNIHRRVFALPLFERHVLHFHPSCFSTHRPCCTSLQRVSVRCGWYGWGWLERNGLPRWPRHWHIIIRILHFTDRFRPSKKRSWY